MDKVVNELEKLNNKADEIIGIMKTPENKRTDEVLCWINNKGTHELLEIGFEEAEYDISIMYGNWIGFMRNIHNIDSKIFAKKSII